MKTLTTIILFCSVFFVYGAEPSDSFNLLWARATDYSFNKEHENAVIVINILISSFPDEKLLYLKRSGEYSRMNKFDLAIKDIYKSLSIDPENIDALTLLALLKVETGQVESGLVALNSIQINDSVSDYYKMTYYCNSFNIYVSIKDYSKAKEIAKELLKYQKIHGRMSEWLLKDLRFKDIKNEDWFKEIIQALK